MKLLLDVNLSRTWKAVLREQGIAVIHWEDVGPDNSEDGEIIEYAVLNNYVIMTNDGDFALMLARSQALRPSVVHIRSGSLLPEDMKSRVVLDMKNAASALESGALLTIKPERTRLSILPIIPKNKV